MHQKAYWYRTDKGSRMDNVLLTNLGQPMPADDSTGLFDKIITAVRQERQFKHTQGVLYFFIALFILSATLLPFSLKFFVTQWNESGIFYFIWAALAHPEIFLSIWQDFVLSIIEVFPLMAAIALVLNIALLLFSIRLFLHKKGLIFTYLTHK